MEKSPEPWLHRKGDFYYTTSRVQTMGGWHLYWMPYHWATSSSTLGFRPLSYKHIYISLSSSNVGISFHLFNLKLLKENAYEENQTSHTSVGLHLLSWKEYYKWTFKEKKPNKKKKREEEEITKETWMDHGTLLLVYRHLMPQDNTWLDINLILLQLLSDYWHSCTTSYSARGIYTSL